MSILKDFYIGKLSTEYRMGPIRVAILRRLLIEVIEILKLYNLYHPMIAKIEQALEDTDDVHE